jgi:hypothetical protein
VRKRIRLLALLAATGLSAPLFLGHVVPVLGAAWVGIPRAEDTVGVYGYARRVVLEPNAENPQRMQVWGTFSVAVPEPGANYQAPERGYLYFALPSDVRTTLNEWANLKRLADTGGPWINAVGQSIYYGIVAFGTRGTSARVRTSDEKPDHPDTYGPGNGVVQVSYGADSTAVKMLGRLPKPSSRANYAVVDRVVLEPNAAQPDRIQIWGVFAIGGPDDYSYAAPQRGYLYFVLSPGRQEIATERDQWNDWGAVAGTRQVVGFFTFYHRNVNVRVRPLDERPDAPDPYTLQKTPPRSGRTQRMRRSWRCADFAEALHLSDKACVLRCDSDRFSWRASCSSPFGVRSPRCEIDSGRSVPQRIRMQLCGSHDGAVRAAEVPLLLSQSRSRRTASKPSAPLGFETTPTESTWR